MDGETRLLDGTQATKFLGFKNKGSLAVMRHYGRGPKFVRLGRSIRYRLSDLTAYIDSCVETPGEAPRQGRRRR